MTKRIAIQGVSGAFHEIAARQYFKGINIDIIPCIKFEDLFTAINNNDADCAIMAIENTVAGGLLSNYTLIQESNYKIVGETYIRIQQNLLALEGQTIEDIKEVHSHYMAIAQTRAFFSKYPNIKLVESDDTALSAMSISAKKEKNIGAIASTLAAEKYGLSVLAHGIETHKKNYTRFLIIEKEENSYSYKNKSSISFSLPHIIGSLSEVLSTLSSYDINLTKIQSLPKMGNEWEYIFYIDIVYNKYEDYKQAILEIESLCTNLKILGEYTKANMI